MFHIYILYSDSSKIYYVGHTNNVERRLEEHNNPIRTTYTSKHLPWKLTCAFPISDKRFEAIMAEKLIKRRKSRKYIESLCKNELEQLKLKQKVREINS